MENRIKYFGSFQYRGGRPTTLYGLVNTDTLSKLFKVHRKTIKRWIKEERFDPADLLSIYKYMKTREK